MKQLKIRLKKDTLSYFISASSALLLPLVTLAVDATQIQGRVDQATSTLQLVIALLFVLATLIFLWGVIRFISSAGDEAARTKAKGIMTWGIIGLAVMAAAWGVVNILVNYFGVGGVAIPGRGSPITVPQQ